MAIEYLVVNCEATGASPVQGTRTSRDRSTLSGEGWSAYVWMGTPLLPLCNLQILGGGAVHVWTQTLKTSPKPHKLQSGTARRPTAR